MGAEAWDDLTPAEAEEYEKAWERRERRADLRVAKLTLALYVANGVTRKDKREWRLDDFLDKPAPPPEAAEKLMKARLAVQALRDAKRNKTHG